eukprot:8975402-Lingulodinium_polyedra.AAC.1
MQGGEPQGHAGKRCLPEQAQPPSHSPPQQSGEEMHPARRGKSGRQWAERPMSGRTGQPTQCQCTGNCDARCPARRRSRTGAGCPNVVECRPDTPGVPAVCSSCQCAG